MLSGEKRGEEKCRRGGSRGSSEGERNLKLSKGQQARGLAQSLGVLAALAEDTGSVPSIHIVQLKNHF